MNLEDIKKEDFCLSGAGEVAPIYICGPIFGVFISVDDTCFMYFMNNVGYGYVNRKGLTDLKEKTMNTSYSELEEKVNNWNEQWEEMDDDLYKMATNNKNDWRKNWGKADELNKELWAKSYVAEIFDNFSDEVEELLIKKIEEAGLNSEILNELVLPIEPTKVQEALLDREKIKIGAYKKEDFIRDYWYMHGNWGGGEILNMYRLEKDLEEENEHINFDKRKEIHALADEKLDDKTLNLIKILRRFALWRDERKTFMQRMSLIFSRIVEQASNEIGVEKRAVEYAMFSEVDLIKDKERDFLERSKKSVLFFCEDVKNGAMLEGEDADEIIKEFKKIDEKEIKGTIACTGKAEGPVKVIMKTEEFDQFKKGDVLVTGMTRPEFVSLMKIASAIVTDEGGLTSHAAIVSRELGVPCIVGTKNATQILNNGDQVEVDADKGIVSLI